MQPGELFDVGIPLGNIEYGDVRFVASPGPDYALLAEMLGEPSPPTLQPAVPAAWPPDVAGGPFMTHYQLPEAAGLPMGQETGRQQHAALQYTAASSSGTAGRGRILSTIIAPSYDEVSNVTGVPVSAEHEQLRLQCLQSTQQLQQQQQQLCEQPHQQQPQQVSVEQLPQALQQPQQQQGQGEEELQLQALLLQHLLQHDLQDLQEMESELQQDKRQQQSAVTVAALQQLQQLPLHRLQQQLPLPQQYQQRQWQLLQPQLIDTHRRPVYVSPFSGQVGCAVESFATAGCAQQLFYTCLPTPTANNSSCALYSAASLGSTGPLPVASSAMLRAYEQQVQQVQQQPSESHPALPCTQVMQHGTATCVAPPAPGQQQHQQTPQLCRSPAQVAAPKAATAAAGKPPRSSSAGKPHLAEQGKAVDAAAAAAQIGAAIAEAPSMSRFKRNRLRNKANMLQMEAEVERKLREMQLLKEENEQLKLKHQALQLVLAVRDSHVSMLQHYGPPACAHSDAAAVAHALRPTISRASSSSSTTASTATGEQSSSSVQNAPDKAANADSPAGLDVERDDAAAPPAAAAAPPPPPPPSAAVPALADELPAGCCVIFTGRRGMQVQGLPVVPPGLDDWLSLGGKQPSSSCRSRGQVGSAKQLRMQSSGSNKAGNAECEGLSTGCVEWQRLLSHRLQQLAAHAQPLPPVSVASCKQLTVQQAALRYKHHVYKAVLMLQQLEYAPTAAAADAAREQLCEMINHLGFNSMGMMVLNPTTTIRMCANDMETGLEINPHEQDQHWTAVVLGLELTEQQQALFLTIFELIARDLLAISRQRKKLLGEIVMAAVAAERVRQTQAQQKAAGTTNVASIAPAAAAVSLADGAATGSAAAAEPHILAASKQLMTGGASGGGAAGMLRRQMQHLAALADSAGPELSRSTLDMLEKVQVTVQRELLAAITLNATFVDHILNPVQVAKLHVLAYPIFPNALGMAIAFAKHIGWRPQAGLMARGALTRISHPDEEQQPFEAGPTAAAGDATRIASSPYTVPKSGAPKAAAAVTASASTRGGHACSRRTSARMQGRTVSSSPGGLVSISSSAVVHKQGAPAPGADSQQPQNMATLEGSGVSYGVGGSCREDDYEAGPGMPEAVADMLTDVQCGRLAAATLILQAAEQTVRLVAE